MLNRSLIFAAALSASAGTCFAAQVYVVQDLGNTIPGTRSFSIMADGEGLDWNVAAMKLDLTAGSVYNDPDFDALVPQDGFWPTFPDLEWDTWFGVPGDATNGIAGGAGDLGGGALNAGGTGVDAISVSWFNTTFAQTGLTRIGTFTLTNDAVGTWEITAGFGTGVFVTTDQVQGTVVPEPASLALLGLFGVAALRRR